MNTQTIYRPIRRPNIKTNDYLKLFFVTFKISLFAAIAVFTISLIIKKHFLSPSPVAMASLDSATLSVGTEAAPLENDSSALAEKLATKIGSLQIPGLNANQLANEIVTISTANSADYLLVTALILKESKFNNLNVNDSKAGLLQISSVEAQVLAQELGLPFLSKTVLLHPAYNLKIGVYKLAKLIKFFNGDIAKALVAFKAGSYTADGFKIGDLNPQYLEYKDDVLKIQESLSQAV